MSETQTLVDVGKLEVKVEELRNDFGEFKKEFKSDFKLLSSNVTTALTEFQICQAEFKATTQKVDTLERDKINPAIDDLAVMKPTVRLIKWVASVSFASVLTFALYLLASHLDIVS